MVLLFASLSPISPDHCLNSHPVEGTAVNVTSKPLEYVPAAFSGGSYVILPPCSGALTTVSFLSVHPQAQTLSGAAEGSSNATHAAMTATSQISLNHPLDFITLLSSIDGY
jgi:hypothetical protein